MLSNRSIPCARLSLLSPLILRRLRPVVTARIEVIHRIAVDKVRRVLVAAAGFSSPPTGTGESSTGPVRRWRRSAIPVSAVRVEARRRAPECTPALTEAAGGPGAGVGPAVVVEVCAVAAVAAHWVLAWSGGAVG